MAQYRPLSGCFDGPQRDFWKGKNLGCDQRIAHKDGEVKPCHQILVVATEPAVWHACFSREVQPVAEGIR